MNTIIKNIITSLFALSPLFFQAQIVQKLSNDQFAFVEGPVWDNNEIIYFSDIPNSAVIAYNLRTDSFSQAFSGTNRSNGLMFNKDFDLILCEGQAGRLTRREVNGTLLEVLATQYNNIRFNDPNDLCIDAKGGIYFTDPNFASTHQPVNRLYYRNSTGVVSVQDTFASKNPNIDANRHKPNGVIISPNGLFLYISNTLSKNVYKYNINQTTGNLVNKTLYGELTNADSQGRTGADGMAVDANGRVYVTAGQTIQIFDGKQLAPVNTIHFPENTTNCTFGGVGKDILFVTATNNLYKVIDLGVTGVQHPFDLPNTTLNVTGITQKKGIDSVNSMRLVSKKSYRCFIKKNNN